MDDTKIIDKGISNIVGALTDPIIVWPGGWEDTLPEWIKPEITLERLIENMKALKGEEPTGTDAEACAYLYTLNLCQPVSHDWVNIYSYLVGKLMKGRGTEMPEDIKVESLSKHEQRELKGLKDSIYRQRTKAREEKERGKRREDRKAAEEFKAAENPRLF